MVIRINLRIGRGGSEVKPDIYLSGLSILPLHCTFHNTQNKVCVRTSCKRKEYIKYEREGRVNGIVFTEMFVHRNINFN